MNGQEILRAEWATTYTYETKSSEIFQCWCYEFTRQHLIELRQRQAVVDAAIAAGEEVPLPEVKAARLDWDDPWGGQFKTPYLLLNPQRRALLNDFYDTDLTKTLQDIIKRGIKSAEKGNGEPSADRLKREVDSYQSMRARFSKVYGVGREGRAAFKAQLRVDLRALGVYRLEKARYRFGRLPREPYDIQLYSSQQRWNEARKRAHLLVQFAPVFVARFLMGPRNS